MRKVFRLFLIFVGTLLISSGHARAASAAVCNVYAKEAAAKARGVREFACGYDLKDPRWTAERTDHARWCKAAPEDAVAREAAHRRGEMKLCDECRVYARAAAQFAAQNRKLKCGFSGPRWGDDAQGHFGWCMALRDNQGAPGADVAASQKAIPSIAEKSTDSEMLGRIQQIATCKSR
jgi:hypothetical protein